jgi:hypothetical protein
MGVKERPNVAKLAIDKADYLIKEKKHKQVTPSRKARTTTPRETWPLTNLWPLENDHTTDRATVDLGQLIHAHCPRWSEVVRRCSGSIRA